MNIYVFTSRDMSSPVRAIATRSQTLADGGTYKTQHRRSRSPSGKNRVYSIHNRTPSDVRDREPAQFVERRSSERHREGHLQQTASTFIGFLEGDGTQNREGPDTGTEKTPPQSRGLAVSVGGTEAGAVDLAKRSHATGLGDKDPNPTRVKGNGI